MSELEEPSEFRRWAFERKQSLAAKKVKVQAMQNATEQEQEQDNNNQNSSTLNYEMIEYLQEMLNVKTTELEMTAEYGLELSNKNDQLQAEIGKMAHDMEFLRGLNRALEGQITELRVALEDQIYRNEHKEGEEEDEEKDIRVRNAEINSVQQQNRIKKMEIEINELREALRLAEDGNGEQKQREDWLKGQVNRLKERCRELEEEREKWRIDEELLREELDRTPSLVKGGSNDELVQQLNESLLEKSFLTEKNAALLEKIEQLNKELDDLKEGGQGQIVREDSSRSLGIEVTGEDLEGLNQFDGFSIGVERPSFVLTNLNLNTALSEEQMEINCNLEMARELIDEDDVFYLISYLNKEFSADAEAIGHKFPLRVDISEIFYACKSGVLLCKLVNKSHPETIDERVIALNPTNEEVLENFNLCIDSCKSIGCTIPKDLDLDRLLIGAACEHLLQILWTLIRSILVKKINIYACPDLRKLALESDSGDELVTMSPELLIIRWVNYHLKTATHLKIKKFDDDFSTLDVFSHLLEKIHELPCPYMKLFDPNERIDAFIQSFSETFTNSCVFINANGLLHRNPKMVFAFLANLFSLGTGLEGGEVKEEEENYEGLHSKATDAEREAEVLKLWLNSLGIEPPIVDVVTDLGDGLFLLKVFDKLNPGSVDWSQVATKTPVPKFKRLQNANYAFQLAKVMKISTMIGISGVDLESGNQKMTLAFVWLIMRYHIQLMLMAISSSDIAITDTEVLAWANAKVAETGQKIEIKSFKDEVLRDGKFFLHLMDSLKPGVVKHHLIKHENNHDSHVQNCRYAISIARKIGAGIFVCVEDIISLRSKLIFIFVAALMATVTQDQKKKKKQITSIAPTFLAPGPVSKAAQMSTNLESPSFIGKVPQNNVIRTSGGSTFRKSGNVPAFIEKQMKDLADENIALKKQLQQIISDFEKFKQQKAVGTFVLQSKQYQSSPSIGGEST